MDNNLIFISGYDKKKRGPQTISLQLNQETFEVPVTVKVPARATVSLNPYYRGAYLNHDVTFYKGVYIKGIPFDFAQSNLKATVKINGVETQFSVKNGDLWEEDVKGFVPTKTGVQTLILTLDDASAAFEVYVADIEPVVYFDYGYMRQASDPTGRGPGAGKYYVQPNETLVLAPVRVLLGFDENHQDLGATYSCLLPEAVTTQPPLPTRKPLFSPPRQQEPTPLWYRLPDEAFTLRLYGELAAYAKGVRELWDLSRMNQELFRPEGLKDDDISNNIRLTYGRIYNDRYDP
jgi:hypothetical protein